MIYLLIEHGTVRAIISKIDEPDQDTLDGIADDEVVIRITETMDVEIYNTDVKKFLPL